MANTDIGEALRQAIRDSGIPFDQIARDTGVAQPTIWRFAVDRKDVKLSTAVDLAAYLGLTLTPTKKTRAKAGPASRPSES